VFFSKKYYAINTKIVETLNMIAEKKNYANKIALVEYDVIDGAIAQNQNFFDLMIYIGDKRIYQPLKKKISIPSIYSGYGNVDVFIESKDFKDLLLDMNKYAGENNININYYDNTSMEETLSFINKYDITDCFVVLSKNTEMIYKFISEIKAKNIYINRSPFEEYKLGISEKDLIYSKNIIMN
jgi:gamma-glutamyl phosphate reductase